MPRKRPGTLGNSEGIHQVSQVYVRDRWCVGQPIGPGSGTPKVERTSDGCPAPWYDAGQPESPDLRVVRTILPNRAVDCTVSKPARFPRVVGVAGLTQGDVGALMDRLGDLQIQRLG